MNRRIRRGTGGTGESRWTFYFHYRWFRVRNYIEAATGYAVISFFLISVILCCSSRITLTFSIEYIHNVQ